MADDGEMTEKLPSADAGSGTFKEAFAAARRQGSKQFTWQGKRYTTELAADKKAPAVPGRPRGESVSEPPNPRAGEVPAPADFSKSRESTTEDKAKRFAGELSDTAKKALAATGIGGGLALGAKRLYGAYKGVQAAKSARAAAAAEKAAERQRGIAEVMEAGKPILQARPGKASPRARTRETPDAEEFKKGGKVKKYAKGGSVRGDGICQRGKTKGTMR